MNYKDVVKEKLKNYSKEDIIIADHAMDQAIFRGIGLAEVKANILNPERLAFARKQEAKRDGEEKYDCYFGYTKYLCHRYALVINSKCIVCTVIKINARWQRIVEKYAKI